ncbi:MAG TPA: hypothetical protein VHI13_16350 [Candidatus Kapabacteria bacterium]|nr:hypothetical protein [Candidatus Kapabacteria bacterium]
MAESVQTANHLRNRQRFKDRRQKRALRLLQRCDGDTPCAFSLDAAFGARRHEWLNLADSQLHSFFDEPLEPGSIGKNANAQDNIRSPFRPVQYRFANANCHTSPVYPLHNGIRPAAVAVEQQQRIPLAEPERARMPFLIGIEGHDLVAPISFRQEERRDVGLKAWHESDRRASGMHRHPCGSRACVLHE